MAVTSSRDILRDIGGGQGPQKSLIAFGYAGWGPGQLESELARNDWKILEGDATAPVDGYLVFQMNAWNQVEGTVKPRMFQFVFRSAQSCIVFPCCS